MELKFDPKKPKYVFVTTPDGVAAALEELERQPAIGLDVESVGLNPYTDKLLLIQLGTPDTSFIFDARVLNLADYPRFRELLENQKIVKITHNGKFDYQFIKLQVRAALSNIYDTMLADAILNAGLIPRPPSLKALAQKYLDIILTKDVRESFENYTGEITEDQLRYSALDTLVLFPIVQAQTQKLQQEGMFPTAKLEFAVTKVVAEMELKGVYVDIDKWRTILKNLEVKRNDFAAQFQAVVRPYYQNGNQHDLFGNAVDPININSQVQLMDLFNNRLGVELPSTGAAFLESVNHPVAKLLNDYRGYEKLLSAFGEKLLSMINPQTKRLHPDFMQLGAATGRFSCQRPNLQQIPRNSEEAPFRECFNPEPGYKLVTADYSSIEMRILADLSEDANMIKALTEGLDIHSYTASLMFNKPYTKDFKKLYPDLRQIAKPIGFGLMYGMGPVGLAAQLKVEPKLAEDYMSKYFQSYPSVQKFLDGMAKNAVRQGWSSTRGGRKRWYELPTRDDPEYRRKVSKIEREAKNHPIQGTSADMIKYALVFLQDRLKKERVEGSVILTVHDEIVSEIREDQAEQWSQIQSEEMVRAGQLFIKKVPVVSEPSVSDAWEHG